MHLSYYSDYIRGQEHFRCKWCEYDTFELARMIYHSKEHKRPDIPDSDLSLTQWLVREKDNGELIGSTVALCLLTFNNHEAADLAAKSIADEFFRLINLGMKPRVLWFDNGSDKETIDAVFRSLQFARPNYDLSKTNLGQSTGRNRLINLAQNCEYVLFLDGDIQLIPYSVYSMCLFLKRHSHALDDKRIGCFGFNSSNCSHINDETIATDCRTISNVLVNPSPRIAWTQYGVFLGEMFAKGLRFDTDKCFLGPGWGFEDNDFYFSMLEAGYCSFNTIHWRYLHKHRNSSLNYIDREAAVAAFNARRHYMKDKWKDFEPAQEFLCRIDGLTLPMPPVIVK